MRQQLENPTHRNFLRHVQAYKKDGMDAILGNAPHLILTASSKDFKNGVKNTISAFSYLELFATSLVLESCWVGLFEVCAFSN